MAVGALARCLRQYGEATLITALQCVTRTSNNQPGALSARTIKAMCYVLHSDRERRDSGLALLEAFDSIDLMAIEDASAMDAAVKKIGRVQAMADRIRADLEHFSIRLGVSRVREISVAFFFGNTFEKRGDCSPKLLNGARLHFA